MVEGYFAGNVLPIIMTRSILESVHSISYDINHFSFGLSDQRLALAIENLFQDLLRPSYMLLLCDRYPKNFLEEKLRSYLEKVIDIFLGRGNGNKN